MTNAAKRKRGHFRRHFHDRLVERFALQVRKSEMEALRLAIEGGAGEPLPARGTRRTRHRVWYKGHDMVVVLDSKYETVVTAYPYKPRQNRG